MQNRDNGYIMKEVRIPTSVLTSTSQIECSTHTKIYIGTQVICSLIPSLPRTRNEEQVSVAGCPGAHVTFGGTAYGCRCARARMHCGDVHIAGYGIRVRVRAKEAEPHRPARYIYIAALSVLRAVAIASGRL